MDAILSAAERMGIAMNEAQAARFRQYLDMLLAWNERMNLTAITDPEAVIWKHFLDSLSLLPLIEGDTLADVGTGAGFPALPLKIMRPELRLTLVDSLGKRLTFLAEVVARLALEHVQLVHARGEELSARLPHREAYDTVTARAVASLAALCRYCLDFVKPGGVLLAMKGPRPEAEIAGALPALQARRAAVEAVRLVRFPYQDMVHSVVVVRKE